MKRPLASAALLLAAAALVMASAEPSGKHLNNNHLQQQQQQQSQLQQAAQIATGELTSRQSRSLSSSSANSGNQLGGQSSQLEHGNSKARLEQEKRQVQEFLTTKNIFKSIVKLLFGNQEEISATSRNVLGILGKVLDLVKNSFGQKSRSGMARTVKDSFDDAAIAGVSVMQGYVKSLLTNNDHCVQRHLCQASREAARDSRDVGYIVASIGGYASSYLLDNSKNISFKNLLEASTRGRSLNEDCVKLYPECTEP